MIVCKQRSVYSHNDYIHSHFCRTRTIHVRCQQTRRHSIPVQLRDRLQEVTEAWSAHALQNPLVENNLDCRIYLAGCVHYAPYQWQLVRNVIDKVKPDIVAIEQPPPTSGSGALLLYPAWLQALLDNIDFVTYDTLVPEEPSAVATTGYRSSTADGDSSTAEASSSDSSHAAAVMLRSLQHTLGRVQQPARVGKDLLDPFEVFGFYPGLDFQVSSPQVTRVFDAFDYLPGCEYVAAVQKAERIGAQVRCVDAPLRVQEGWVRRLVEGFALDEQRLTVQLLKSLERNQAMLLPDYVTWDAELAAAAATAPPEVGMAVYKVSRACAAGTLAPGELDAAVAEQAKLQPLKYAHFAEREAYIANQLRDMCKQARQEQQQQQQQQAVADATAREVQPSGASTSPSPEEVCGAGRSTLNIVVVLGRVHLPGLAKLWNNRSSALWRDVMPKNYAQSTIELAGDPDVRAGGSRPVGQQVMSVDDVLRTNKRG